MYLQEIEISEHRTPYHPRCNNPLEKTKRTVGEEMADEAYQSDFKRADKTPKLVLT